MPVPRLHLGYNYWIRRSSLAGGPRVPGHLARWSYEFAGSPSKSSTRFREPRRSWY